MIQVNRMPLRGRIFLSGLLLCWTMVTTGAQPFSSEIRVVSPQDGATFEPGAQVAVVVEPEGSTPLQEVVIATPSAVERAVTSPFQLTFSAPQDLGPKRLAIAAEDQRHKQFFKEITYHVETTTPIQSIQVRSTRVGRPANISLIRGVMEQRLSIDGIFADGKTRDISKSREINYSSSNPQVVTVTPDGLVKAIGEGAATITITYKGKPATVPVKVEFERQSIKIDIRPGDPNNRINLDSGGSIPVAILTTNTFDVTRVDPLTVRFGPNGAMEEHGRGHFEDVDGDGFSDMVLHFRQPETGIQCLQKTATLTGSTFDGVLIKGTDFIRPRGNNCIEIPRR